MDLSADKMKSSHTSTACSGYTGVNILYHTTEFLASPDKNANYNVSSFSQNMIPTLSISEADKGLEGFSPKSKLRHSL